MRVYNNIQTSVNETVNKDNSKLYDIVIATEGIKAFALTDVEYARVLQALKILDSKRFEEEK